MKQEQTPDDIQVLEPKKGKPPLNSSKNHHQAEGGKYTGEGAQNVS